MSVDAILFRFDEPKVIIIDQNKMGQIFHNQSFDDTKVVSLTQPNNISKVIMYLLKG